MSDAQADNAQTVKGLILVVLAAIVGIPLFIILIVKLFSAGSVVDTTAPEMKPAAVAERIGPVGTSKLDESGPPGSRDGKTIYASVCISCHGVGLAGAPKFGDAGAWAPRISKGFETLVNHAQHGFNAMPARGGASDLTDDEVARAVAYIANAAGAKFTEPAIKAAPAAASTADASPAATPVAAAPAAMPAAAPAAPVVAAADAKVDPATKGKEIYNTLCVACHATGAAGAPKFGDKAAWAPRLKGGVEAAIQIAIKGINAMPPKGGYTGSDAEFHAAAEYLIGASK